MKWISVKDKLPEPNQFVIFWIKERESFDRGDYREWEDGNNSIETEGCHSCRRDIPIEFVTHWAIEDDIEPPKDSK